MCIRDSLLLSHHHSHPLRLLLISLSSVCSSSSLLPPTPPQTTPPPLESPPLSRSNMPDRPHMPLCPLQILPVIGSMIQVYKIFTTDSFYRGHNKKCRKMCNLDSFCNSV